MRTGNNDAGRSRRHTLAIGHIIGDWDSVLASGLGSALLVAIVTTVVNHQPVDIQRLLADIGVDEVNRMLFQVNKQPKAEQITVDLQNFFATHTVMSWSIIGGALVIEVL